MIAAEKLDFKKLFKDLYTPSSKVVSVVTVPRMKFLSIDGRGDPNGPEFSTAVGALYSLSYTIKFWAKKHPTPIGFVDFGVAPLEGLWWVEGTDLGPNNFMADRENWRWTAMIMQPDFVTEDLFDQVLIETSTKKPNPLLGNARLCDFQEGLSIQIMHVGPYYSEPATIAKMIAFSNEHGYESNGRHHEIYFGDPRRTAPEKLKTLLRHPVKKV